MYEVLLLDQINIRSTVRKVELLLTHAQISFVRNGTSFSVDRDNKGALCALLDQNRISYVQKI